MPITKEVYSDIRLTLSVAVMGIISLCPLQAAAETFDEVSPERINPSRFEKVKDRLNKWNVVIGAGGIYAPKFEGSDEFEVQPFPMFSATFGEHVTVDPRGISIDVYRYQNFNFTAKIGYEAGRQEDDSDHLKGLGDVDAGAVIGGKLAYELGPVELFTSFDKTIGGSDGLVGTVGASVSHSYKQFLFSAGASATWADANHMESYFGVTSAQSARSGLAAYDAGAGFKRVDFEASVTYVTEKSWLIQGQIGVGYLVGDAADSPIVQDAFQPSAMLMLGYKF
ncbi:MipA/OmpV family protein [Phyllobacterium ifriqiyense]|uniref:MipA/OmpV family protein n=1 Tax=Phyllobacterium TaxID=28100 RepID=UPI0033959183